MVKFELFSQGAETALRIVSSPPAQNPVHIVVLLNQAELFDLHAAIEAKLKGHWPLFRSGFISPTGPDIGS